MPLVGMAGSSVMMLPAVEALNVAVENGFSAFEIFGEFPQCVCDEMSNDDRKAFRRIADGSGVGVAIHAPFNDCNIASLNPGIRKESIKQVTNAIELCADVGGDVVVVHTGEYLFSEKSRENIKQAFDLQWGLNIESLAAASKKAEELGINLCLENIGFEPKHMDHNVDDLLKIKAEINSPALKFCLDIGHARLNNELPQAIEKLGGDIRHIHFTDNFGEFDDHFVIGEGDFDYSPHLDFFKSFEHIMTLEVIDIGTDPEKAMKSKKYVDGLLGS